MHRKAQQDPSELVWYLIYLPATFFVFIMVSMGVNDQLNELNQPYNLDQVFFLTNVRYRLAEPDVTTQQATWSHLDYSRVTQNVINQIGQSDKEMGVRLHLSGAACDQPPQFCTFSSDYSKNPACASAASKSDCAFERLRPLIQWKGSLQIAHYTIWNTEKINNFKSPTPILVEAVFAK